MGSASIRRMATGGSLTARAVRSSMLTISGYGFAQVVRLLSNLVLTRLLFPEAFGLMGLVAVFLTALTMFSDFGIGPSIAQSQRGDDPDFLDTAWTLNLLRGGVLFALGCALAWPVAAFYDEPVLAGMLALASVQFLIAALMPTRRETATRHLMLGRVTLLEMIAQLISLAVLVALAFWFRSVWALVWGTLVGVAVQVALMSAFLPGQRNRLCLDRLAVRELLHFGKWIFLSTICGLLLSQGDKLILGKFLPLDAFGVYGIGFFLGSFPMLLGMVLITRILIPIYRDRPPGQSRENFLKLRKMRNMISASLMAMLAIVALSGPWLVELLYDDRYRDAGAIVVLVACVQIPVIIGLTYDQAALAAGDSRRFLLVSATRAVLVVAGIFIGVQMAGLPGAIIGQGLGTLAAYPALVWLAVRLEVWDASHDLGFAALGLLCIMAAVLGNWQALALLAGQ